MNSRIPNAFAPFLLLISAIVLVLVLCGVQKKWRSQLQEAIRERTAWELEWNKAQLRAEVLGWANDAMESSRSRSALDSVNAWIEASGLALTSLEPMPQSKKGNRKVDSYRLTLFGDYSGWKRFCLHMEASPLLMQPTEFLIRDQGGYLMFQGEIAAIHLLSAG